MFSSPPATPSPQPLAVHAWVIGPALLVRAVIREDLPAAERAPVLGAVRQRIAGLLRWGTEDDGWRWDAARELWTAAVALPVGVRVQVPDHVPAEWVRGAA